MFAQELGFEIINNYSQKNKFFNIKESYFTYYEDIKYGINAVNSLIISKLLNTCIEENDTIKMTNKIRQEVLQQILDYYSFHIEDLTYIKSLKVLNQIFE